MKSVLINIALLTTAPLIALADLPRHLELGLQLHEEITSAQSEGIFNDAQGVPLNRYDGSWNSLTNPSYIRLADFSNGIYAANNTVCAPLVTHLLKEAYGWNWKNYSFTDPLTLTPKSVGSPYPFQYIALLKENKGFAQRVFKLSAARPGDILLWWTIGSTDNDHAMIIVNVDSATAKPYPATLAGANPALANTTFYEVTVLDSSSGLHTADTRLVRVDGVVTHIPGIGMGKIGILVDTQSEIAGTTWSLPTSNYYTQQTSWLNGLHSRLKLQSTREAVIGRIP